MFNLKRFSKISSGAKHQFRQSTLVQKKSSYRYAHIDSSSSRKSNVGKYAMGSLIFGFSSIVIYAKYDTKFRQWLKANVYGSDELLKLLLFEDKFAQEQPSNVESRPSPPTNKSTVNISKLTPPILESKAPKIVSKKLDNSLDKGLNESKNILGNKSEKQPSSIRDIDSEATLLFKKVSISYSEALNALKNYYEILNGIVNNVSHKSNDSSLAKLKKIGVEKDELFETAKVNALEASKRLDQIQIILDDSKIEATSEVKDVLKNKIVKLKMDIKTLEKDLEAEKDNLLFYNNYNNQVVNIRKRFSDELQTLFPHVRLEDKDMKLSNAEFDIFVEYITQKLLYYQNELFKQETIGEEHVNDVVNALKNGNPDAIDKVLKFQVEKNQRKHVDNFIKESLGSKASCEAKFKQQLRLQTEVHMDHLKEAASLSENEVDRRVRLEYTEKAEIEKLKYQEQVSGMTAVMHAINDTLKEHSDKRNKLNDSVFLWTACQSLLTAITTDHNASKHELKPLKQLVNDIKKAGENHKIINELLDTIPERVLTRGVYTENTLKDRFFSVEDKAFHMALVPDTNVKLFDLVTSFVFTIFTFKSLVPIPEEELNNTPINASELNNIDILQRAKYWIEQDNYYQALRYMNLLKGGAKIIAEDWMNETREYLATQQAAQTLLAYASARLKSHIVSVNSSST